MLGIRYFTLLCLLLTISFTSGAKNQIVLGGLFDTEDESQELAFQYTIDAINEERNFLPRHRLVPAIVKVPQDDSLKVSEAVCELLEQGAIGIFGPTTGGTSHIVQSICDTKNVPHIEIRMDPVQRRGECLMNVFPQPATLGRVFLDIVKAWEWKTFTILYENSDSFPRLSELLKMYDHKGYTVTVRQLDLGLGNNYRPILRRVKISGETNFVLDCSIDKLREVLLQAQQIGIMADHHNYIITNHDMHTIDMEPFKHGGVNITGIRFLDPEDQYVIDIAAEWSVRNGDEPIIPENLTSGAALMHDAVWVFAQSLRDLNASRIHGKSQDCENDESWEHGFSMINYMKMNYIKGLTGTVKFDHEGFRTDFLLDIVELTPSTIHKIGTWNSTEGLNLTRVNNNDQMPFQEGSLVNRTFKVLTALSSPYGMLKEASVQLTGNDRFEGFGIEVIEEIGKMLGFNYTFIIQHDGKYGTLDRATNKWNGMVQELLDWKVDLAITDLTITSDRESAVDFTMPFMNLGISILYAKPSKQAPSLFSFMSPFSNQVWLLLGIAYMSASILLFMSGRLAPKEWQNPYPCIQEPEHLENQFSMANSLWFMVGAVLQQGSELAPIAISTRMIAGVWWFFTLIMVSSYTANLAAFLTVESLYSPINSANDLATNEVGITYGAKGDGSTLTFFRDADDAIYKKMYQYMMDHPESLTRSNDEGVNKVLRGNYAYLMESTSIEYIIERNCDLTMINGLLDDKGYGIAMRKNSSYRNMLSAAVLKLQETGKLTAMKKKWWTEKRGGGACSGSDESSGGALSLTVANVGGVFVVLVVGCVMAMIVTITQMLWDAWMVARAEKAVSKDENNDLGMDNVGGVFVVLLGGCAVSALIAIAEMLIGVMGRAKKYKVPFTQELMEELRFVAKCSGDTKPVRHRKSGSASEASGSEPNSELGKSKETLQVPTLEKGNRKDS